MKHIRVLIVLTALFAAWTAQRALAQVSVQHMGFSLVTDFENDVFTTNGAAVTEDSYVDQGLVVRGNVVRAILYDMFGPEKWTELNDSILVREVNLSTGAEGIFLRHLGVQTNVSQFFTTAYGPSYSNDFKSEVSTAFPAISNGFTPTLPLNHGSVHTRGGVSTTNYPKGENLFFTAFTSSNLQFNVVGYGTVQQNQVLGRLNGVLYSNLIEQFNAQGVGTLTHTDGTNVFGVPGEPATSNASGLAHGSFWIGPPIYLALTNGP